MWQESLIKNFNSKTLTPKKHTHTHVFWRKTVMETQLNDCGQDIVLIRLANILDTRLCKVWLAKNKSLSNDAHLALFEPTRKIMALSSTIRVTFPYRLIDGLQFCKQGRQVQMSSGLLSGSLRCDWQDGGCALFKKEKEKKKANPKPGGEPWDPHGSHPLKASRLEIRLKNDGALL